MCAWLEILVLLPALLIGHVGLACLEARGLTAIRLFHQCASGRLNDTLRDPWAVLRDTEPIADIVYGHVETYCRLTLPEAIQCMRDRISHCDETTRDYILGLARKGSGLCDGFCIKYSFASVLSQLPKVAPRDAGLCTHVDYLPCFLRECDGTTNTDLFNLTIQDIVPIVRRSYTCLAECLASAYHNNQQTCPHWQFHFLLTHRQLFLPVRLALDFHQHHLMLLTDSSHAGTLRRVASSVWNALTDAWSSLWVW